MGEVVGLHGEQGLRSEAEGATDGSGSSIAGGEDVYVRVANHEGLSWGYGFACQGGGFGDQSEKAVWIGLFGMEAVPTIVLEEELRESEVGADIAGGIDRFICEDGHGNFGAGCTDGFERRDYAGVDVGEIELMDTVVVEKIREDLGYIFFIVNVAFGVAEGTADEHGSSVANVAGDDRLWKRRFVEVVEGGVDRVAEVDAGVDQRAVKIEDDEAGKGSERHFLTIIEIYAVSSLPV